MATEFEKGDAEKKGHELIPVHVPHIDVLEENAVALDAYAHTSIPREKVSFEERIWYANFQRKSYGMHDSNGKAGHDRWFHFFDNHVGPDVPENPLICHDEPLDQFDHLSAVKADKWTNIQADAARAKSALRVASWISAFYLITTDALGPFNAPYAVSQLGWIPGLLSYLVMGIAVFWSSWLITNLFLRLDSDRHPVRTFGDLMYVFFGRIGFWVAVFCQIMMLYISGSANILGASQSVFLVDNSSFCFIVTMVLMTVAAYCISLPLRSIGWLAYLCSASVYLNLLIMFLSMGFISHSPPFYEAAQQAYGTEIIPGPPYLPVETPVILYGRTLSARVNGVSNAIYAWGAIMMYIEFLAEMRRPQTFWKSFCGGEGLCFCVYMAYSSFVYYYQGQYTQALSYQGISKQSWADVCNIISIFTQIFACVLYIHIAMKVFWQTLCEDVFKFPSTQIGVRGWVLWIALNTAVYPLVFVVSAAIPQLFTISALFAALFGLQFSFTFPPLMQFAYDVMADASRLDDVYVPGEEPKRYDTWWQRSRWMRGLFTGRIFMKALNGTYTLAALALCGLGAWGSIEAMITTFQQGAGTSFGCNPFV